MNEFMKAMEFRHACKLFDDKKKIPKKEMNVILEAGRLSPSSFGLEPWHFLVIENVKIKEALRIACWDQPQVTTSSHFVVLLSRKAKFFKEGSEYLDESFGRKAKDEKTLKNAEKAFSNFVKKDLGTDVKNWAKMQVYIAGANMMSAAAFIGIDSCPMEGFNAKALRKALIKNVPPFDNKSYGIACAIAFGYGVDKRHDKIRWSLEKITTFVK
ncbi:MAG: NAD(P)H-dependent oxidoreductase [Campylobacteraceae bacterium]|jgi:nitroreductase|nr:NAD(P)H-dependent oxidoreductase [Campylobacteraceae bacterium]